MLQMALWDTVDTINDIYLKPLSKLLDELDTQVVSEALGLREHHHSILLTLTKTIAFRKRNTD